MAKLTRKQRAALEAIERDLKRALAYINAPETAVARRSAEGTTTLHYTRPASSLAPGGALFEVEKEYGSDLVGLASGLSRLRAFLEVEP